MSTIIALADAVAAQLNDAPPGTFSQVFTAQRLHQPSFTLEELQELHVSVVPRSVTVAAASRDSSMFECAIDIGIQRKIDSDNDVDALLDLAEEIVDHLRLKRLSGFPEAAWAGIAHEPVVASERERCHQRHIRERLLFIRQVNAHENGVLQGLPPHPVGDRDHTGELPVLIEMLTLQRFDQSRARARDPVHRRSQRLGRDHQGQRKPIHDVRDGPETLRQRVL